MLQKMYTLPHWIAVIRLFGYQTLTMDKAREQIKPIATEFGKEPVADACEVLVEIVPGKEPVARLKAHIKHMAFQILGPEQQSNIAAPAASSADAKPASTPPSRTRKKTPAKVPEASSRAEDRVQTPEITTIMEQYRAAKEKHPDMVIIFRLGDFFEVFDADAEIVHRILGLTLTTRDRVIKMCGFPHHQLEAYLHKLLKAGQRVALCDQVKESDARGPIGREVTRVVTPSKADNNDGPGDNAPEARPIKQPRHHVLQKYQEFLNQNGLAFVAVEDVKKTTPAVAPHVASLDFIVLRGEEKLLVTVRPHLQAKHHNAIAELQKLFGPEYKPVRIWPAEGADGWKWPEHSVDTSQIAPPSSRRKGNA